MEKSLPNTRTDNKESFNQFLKEEIKKQKKEKIIKAIVGTLVIGYLVFITIAFLLKEEVKTTQDLLKCQKTHSSSYCARHFGV